MKRLLHFLFCFLVFLFFCFSVVSAQDFDFNRAYQDYLYNYNLYRSSHLDYIAAKNEYLTYKTLTSQTKALETTKKMLLDRDETIRTYLTALRMKLKESTGILNYQQNLQYIKLDDEITWLASHKSSIPSAATLEDLVNISSQLEAKHPKLDILSYQTLGTVLSGKETNLRDQAKEALTSVENKINQMREAKVDTTTMERWLIEAKQKITRSEEKQTQAQNIVNKMELSDSEKQEKFNEAQKAYEESNQYLKEAISNLKEIILEIKRA